MAKTVRCPGLRCFPQYKDAELAFDGYFCCKYCGTALGYESFIRWLDSIEADLRRQRECIMELRRQTTSPSLASEDTVLASALRLNVDRAPWPNEVNHNGRDWYLLEPHLEYARYRALNQKDAATFDYLVVKYL